MVKNYLYSITKSTFISGITDWLKQWVRDQCSHSRLLAIVLLYFYRPRKGSISRAARPWSWSMALLVHASSSQLEGVFHIRDKVDGVFLCFPSKRGKSCRWICGILQCVRDPLRVDATGSHWSPLPEGLDCAACQSQAARVFRPGWTRIIIRRAWNTFTMKSLTAMGRRTNRKAPGVGRHLLPVRWVC